MYRKVIDTKSDVFVANADGSNEHALTSAGTDGAAVWSHNGRKIAFTSMRDGNLEIYTMRADGSGQQRLTTDPLNDVNPRWSPDDKQILFQSARLGGFPQWRLFVMNADGSDQRPIGVEGGRDMFPEWSPKGDRIVFSSYRDGASKSDLYIMNADGSSLRRLIQTKP